jgi:hypothetical protein
LIFDICGAKGERLQISVANQEGNMKKTQENGCKCRDEHPVKVTNVQAAARNDGVR